MSIQLQIEEAHDYLVARFVGAGAAEEIWCQFELIAERCKRSNKNKLLLSIAEANLKGLSLADRYNLGDKAETFMYYKITKVAVIGSPGQVDSHRFGEKVMRNRWVNARVFTNVEDAENWLLLKPAAPKKLAAGHHRAKSSFHTRHTRS